MIKRTKNDIVRELKERGYKTSFKTKQEAQEFLDKISWFKVFPWHDDQQVILNWDVHDGGKRQSVVQGVFGSGKTTVMMGVYSKLLDLNQIQSGLVVFCAFNVSIKNELRRKLKATGLKQRPRVRTFDSIIYELCRYYEMPGLDKPDYDGRRNFVEKILVNNQHDLYTGFLNTQLLLIDETQDLDYKAYHVFTTFFPNAHIFFFGDIFQCIQKEPRSSLLWHVLQPDDHRRIHFMQKTPRVPTSILDEIKRALIHHYPEYTAPISNWYSSNPIQSSQIRWLPIRHYNDMFKHLNEFLAQHPPNECMVLTFSSAITVRGSLGDLSRFRQFLQKEGHQVNKNYKSMDPDKLFLSTVNSSKGLERPYVFIALSFPLELAFANFSNDLVVNLVSVGLSRCKNHVSFCVPSYTDRFSKVLHLYSGCPQPTTTTNTITTNTTTTKEEETLADILNRSHSATEVIRQGILSFQTRELLRSCAKYTGNNIFPPGDRVRWSMRNEEEASFMGILYEVLITSLWTQRWPEMDVNGMNQVQKNPMYQHCRQNIDKTFRRLVGIFHSPYRCDFDILYDYTEFHILLSQKIRVRIHSERRDEMKRVWNQLRPSVSVLCPHLPNKKAQVNLNRSCLTGVADMICSYHDDNKDPILYEIKTCTNSNWKDDAFTQASLYMSMTQQKKGVVRLLNPFRREMCEYNISLLSKEKQVLTQIDRELLLWNFNCFLAKFTDNVLMPPLPNNIRDYVCECDGVYLEFLASTKARIADTINTKDKIVQQFSHDNPFWNTKKDDNLLQWLMDAVGYKQSSDQKCQTHDDPFFICILMGVHLRKSYSFR